MKFSAEWTLEMNWSITCALLVPPGGDRRHAVHLYKLFADDQSFVRKARVPWCEVMDSDEEEGGANDGAAEDGEAHGEVPKEKVPEAPVPKAPVPKAPVPKAPVPKAPGAGEGLLAKARAIKPN